MVLAITEWVRLGRVLLTVLVLRTGGHISSSSRRLKGSWEVHITNTGLPFLLWSRFFVFLEEDHQEVLQDLSIPQLQPGSGYLHLILLPDLLVQPACLPRTQACSTIRCWDSWISVLHLLRERGSWRPEERGQISPEGYVRGKSFNESMM